MMHGWAPGGTDLYFTPDLGMKMTGDESFLLEVHYNSNDRSAVDASGVEVCVTEAPPENEVVISWLGTDSINGTSATGTCRPRSDEPIHIIGGNPHMHVKGQSMQVVLNRADGIDAVTPLIADRGMELRVEVTPDLRIVANRDALTRILVNLLDNAAKYGPEGQTVRVRTERVGGSARLSVSDEGPGVPVPDRVRVWKAYRRLERDVHAKIPGTGIGLSVVAELAGLHGGKSWVEDAPGGGARFFVEFPARPSTVLSPREVAVPV
jgi:hypothetical protein